MAKLTTALFIPSTPFFHGVTASSRRVPFTFTCAIGGHNYVIEPSQYERLTIDYQRELRDTTNEPGEQTLTQRGAWKRPSRDWRFGAGQDYWDRPESDRARFRSSKGIDIFHNDFEFCLLNSTRNIRASAATNLNVLGVSTSTTPYLYVTDGSSTLFSANPTSASPTWTNSNVVGTVVDFTTDGNSVFCATSTDIKKTVVGSTAETTLSTYDATLVEYANGRLIAAKAGEVVEVSSAGVTTVIKTHDITSFNWTCISGAPNGIYIGGNAGDRSEIFFVGINASTGGLAPAIFAASLPDGEKILAMTFYNGFYIIGSDKGLRMATLGENSISYGPLLAISGGVSNLELQAEDCWFSWTNYDSSSTGLGRARLSRFTFPLVPAYASDLMAGTSASTVQGAVTGVTTFGSYRYFAVSGSGIWAEYASKVATGNLLSGFIEFGVDEPKTTLTMDIRHEPLPAGASVALSVITDGEVETDISSSTTTDSLGPVDPFSMPTIKTEAIEIRTTLNRGTDTTLGPCVRRYTNRSVVNPKRIDEFHVPIWLTETLDVGGGEGVTFTGYDPLTEFQYLKDLEASGAPVRLQLGTQAHDVQIYQVEVPKDDSRHWNTAKSFLEGLHIVHCVTTGAI